GVDADEAPLDQRRARLVDERAERPPRGRLVRERLLDHLRPVDEVGLRRDEHDLGALLGERAEREQALEARDTAAGDDDARASPARAIGPVVEAELHVIGSVAAMNGPLVPDVASLNERRRTTRIP